MIFTRLGMGAAWLALVFGVMRIGVGPFVASSDNPEALAPRYLGSSTSGQAIDHGIYVILFAVALGTLVEISRSLRRDD
jgi:hypothetical protein